MTIEPLHTLLGTWELTGRSADAEADDVFGTTTGTLIVDGAVLQVAGTMRFGEFGTNSRRLIWALPDSDDFGTHTCSKFGPPLDYRWKRHGETLTHQGSGVTSSGTIEDGGRLIVGSPIPASQCSRGRTPGQCCAVSTEAPHEIDA